MRRRARRAGGGIGGGVDVDVQAGATSHRCAGPFAFVGGADVGRAEAEAEGKDENDGRLVGGVLQDARQSSAAGKVRSRCSVRRISI